MKKRTAGVLVMSYGTPQNMDQIESYYTHIRRGRPPSPEQLAELTSRYEAIVGGVFPLRENTNKQVQALERLLNLEQDQIEFRCYQGLKHAEPFIEGGVSQMARDGINEAVGIVLAPHYSSMSVGSYIERARSAAEDKRISMHFVNSYHLHPKLIQAWTKRVTDGLAQFDGAADDIRIIFSAHSLPEKILQMHDPYPDQLLETAGAIAAAANLSNWQFAWQSAGRTAEPWLGPDILDVLETIHTEGVEKVLMCPIGFVSDHLEILYDIDIECKKKAEQQNMKLERTASLNVDPLFIETLRNVVYSRFVKE